MSDLKDLEKFIVDTENFPKEGVTFKDISPMLIHRFKEVNEALINLMNWDGVDAIAGIESRGFIFGAAIAQKLDIGFIPIRKAGKLPPPVHQESYQLEYGSDTLEIKADIDGIKTIVVVDDVIATGGTLKATLNLCKRAGIEPKACLSVINLKFLNNFEDLGASVHSLFEY